MYLLLFLNVYDVVAFVDLCNRLISVLSIGGGGNSSCPAHLETTFYRLYLYFVRLIRPPRSLLLFFVYDYHVSTCQPIFLVAALLFHMSRVYFSGLFICFSTSLPHCLSFFSLSCVWLSYLFIFFAKLFLPLYIQNKILFVLGSTIFHCTISMYTTPNFFFKRI